MHRPLIAAFLGLVVAAPPLWSQQSAQCGFLSDMRQLDAAVADYATRGGDGGTRVAIVGALAALRGRGSAVTRQGDLPGFDMSFVARFVTSREQAIALAARGAQGRTVLQDSNLRSSAQRLSSLYLAFDCQGEEDNRAASGSAAAPVRVAGESGSGKSGSGLASAPRAALDPSGTGRFVKLRDFGGNPWRIDGNPRIWRALAIFLLVFSASVTLLTWLRSIHHRQAERFPCSLKVTLIRNGLAMPALLVDLSHLGAKLRLEHPPGRGEKIVLKWRNVRAEARVVWSNDYFVGLNFLEALGDAECAVLLEAGRAPDGPSFKPSVEVA